MIIQPPQASSSRKRPRRTRVARPSGSSWAGMCTPARRSGSSATFIRCLMLAARVSRRSMPGRNGRPLWRPGPRRPGPRRPGPAAPSARARRGRLSRGRGLLQGSPRTPTPLSPRLRLPLDLFAVLLPAAPRVRQTETSLPRDPLVDGLQLNPSRALRRRRRTLPSPAKMFRRWRRLSGVHREAAARRSAATLAKLRTASSLSRAARRRDAGSRLVQSSGSATTRTDARAAPARCSRHRWIGPASRRSAS